MYIENVVYKINPRTLEELKRNIRDEININRGEVQRVMGNFIKRYQKCMDNEGGQFQHLVSKVSKYDNLKSPLLLSTLVLIFLYKGYDFLEL